VGRNATSPRRWRSTTHSTSSCRYWSCRSRTSPGCATHPRTVRQRRRVHAEIRRYLPAARKLRAIPDVEQQWYQAPGGDYRSDLYGEHYPGSDPETVSRHLFDDFGVDYAILNPLTRGEYRRLPAQQPCCATPRRLSNSVRREDLFARVGDGEFAILLAERGRPHCRARPGGSFARGLERAVRLGPITVQVDTRTAIALYPDHCDHPQELLNRAETAIQHANLTKARSPWHRAVYTSAGAVTAAPAPSTPQASSASHPSRQHRPLQSGSTNPRRSTNRFSTKPKDVVSERLTSSPWVSSNRSR
jgi:hypothetical protein